MSASKPDRATVSERDPIRFDRYRLLQGALVSLQAGPALILLLLVIVVGLTTPVFLTSRNIGNIFSQTSVITVVALGQSSRRRTRKSSANRRCRASSPSW